VKFVGIEIIEMTITVSTCNITRHTATYVAFNSAKTQPMDDDGTIKENKG